jgi:hypothetical protein
MEGRSQVLTSFVEAAAEAFAEYARDEDSRRAVGEIFRCLEKPTGPASGEGHRLPACVHLKEVISGAAVSPSLCRLTEAFRALEPSLTWRQRSFDNTANTNFEHGHANVMVFGPGGHEARNDAWLGATLMAPNVRYPDHVHTPEEVYLMLSSGEFKHGISDWFSPDVGGPFTTGQA